MTQKKLTAKGRAPRMVIQLPARYRKVLESLAAKSGRTIVKEVCLAVDKHAKSPEA